MVKPKKDAAPGQTGEPSCDLSHLREAARQAALLPAEQRLQIIRADRWIGYPRATHVLQRLEEMSTWPARQRMPAMLLIAETNNGKSTVIERFRRAHPRTGNAAHEQLPVLVVQMPSDPTVLRFYTALLARLGTPMRPRSRLAEREQLTLYLLRELHVRVLVIDELHNILAGRSDTRREFLNLLRFLGNELQIPLVGAGTRDAYLAIRADDQLENRFEPFILPRWQPDEQARSLLASFAASFPLRRPSLISGQHMAEYLLSRSEGTIGELATLLTQAAITAVTSGAEAITEDTLKLADYRGPTERRRLFERQLS